MVTFLNSEDIQQVLTPRLCLDALEEAFRDLADRKAATMLGREVIATGLPDKTYPGVAPGKAYYSLEVQTASMPRYKVGVLRLKSDMVHWPRADGGFRRAKVAAASGDQYCGLIILFNIETCEPIAIMPDGLVQRLRVGATNALGVKYLARRNAATVGLIGAGWQAGAQAMTIAAVRPVERIKVFSPTRERREAFAAEMGEQLGIVVEAVDSPLEAARGVDILHSATNARGHTIVPAMVKPGMHLGTISVEEIEDGVLNLVNVFATSRRSRVANSHWAVANGTLADVHEREFADGWWKNERVWERFVELGDLIAGRAQGRRTDDDVTYFHSGGAALQFAAVGAKVLEATRARGLGHEVPVDWFLQPYRP